MAETDVEFVERMDRLTPAGDTMSVSDRDYLFTLARRSAAAGELLEALKGINTTIEQDNIDNRDWCESVAKVHAAARAAIAQFEATAATQETRNG